MDLIWCLNIIESSDIFSSLFLLLLLSCIGGRVISTQPQLDPWSWRLGLGTLLAYILYRSLKETPTTPEELVWILLRGLLAAAFMRTLTRILLPVCVELWTLTVAGPMEATCAALKVSRQWRDQRRIERQSDQYAMAITRELERTAPELERQRREFETQAQVERASAEAANQRREEALLRSELLYERHARRLAASFPRERFEQFVERYMGPETAPALVEQRELLLKEMIVDSLGTTTAPKFPTMTDLAAFFEARRQEIEKLPHEEHVKDTYRTQLNRQEDEALRKFLRP